VDFRTRSVNFELNLVLVSRKSLRIQNAFLVLPHAAAAYFKDRLAAEEVRGLLCNKHCLFYLLLLVMGYWRCVTERGASEMTVYIYKYMDFYMYIYMYIYVYIYI
jgi:hypothetical protein